MFSKLADIFIRVSYYKVIAIIEDKMINIKSSIDFLKKIKLLQIINLYIL